ncbi:hypothetical protein LINPERHAP1_LOCUS36896 [Linum perenne]
MDDLEDIEAEEFRCDPFADVVEEFDLDYEFDAPQYHDFTMPDDDSETEEEDCWLDVASGYPPSPLALKMHWRPLIGSAELNQPSSAPTNSSVEDDDDDNETGSGSRNCKSEDGLKPKGKTKPKPRSAGFMSPTASHLAKKQAAEQMQCERLLRRFPRDARSEGKSSRSSSTSGVPATKRQKLEAGYLRKAAKLKHQAQFPHKDAVKVISKSASGRYKTTVPVQPNLATASRAERHRSRTKSEFENSGQPRISPGETRPVNKKIQKIPSLPIPRKATKQLPELQGAKLHRSKSTSEKENKNLTSLNADLPVRDKQELRERSKSFKIKERKGSTERRVMDEPPVDAFSQVRSSQILANSVCFDFVKQLSIASERTAKLQAKIATATITKLMRHQRVIPSHCQDGKNTASTGEQMGVPRLGLAIRMAIQ